MYDNTDITAPDQPDDEEDLFGDEGQDQFFGEENGGERLDETETDENADEGTGDGRIGRSRDDHFQK